MDLSELRRNSEHNAKVIEDLQREEIQTSREIAALQEDVKHLESKE